GEGQLFDRTGSIRVVGMAVQEAADILTLNQVGKLLPLGGRDLTLAFPQLGRDEAQSQRLIEGVLVWGCHELAPPPQSRPVQAEPPRLRVRGQFPQMPLASRGL